MKFGIRSFIALSLFLFVFFFFPSVSYATTNTGTSTVQVNPGTVTNNGSSQATITVTLLDENSGPETGHTVSLSLSGSDSGLIINGINQTSTIISADHTGSQGYSNVAIFTVRSTTAQTDSFTVTDTTDNVVLNSASITFAAPTPTPAPTSAPSTPTPTPTPANSCNSTVPQAPVLSSAVASGVNQVVLTFADSPDPVSHYLVAYGTASQDYQYGNQNIGPQGTTTYTVNALSSGTTYYFVIKAINGCMPSGSSNELSATPGQTAAPVASDTPVSSDSNSDTGSVQGTEIGPTPTEIPTEFPTNIPSTPATSPTPSFNLDQAMEERNKIVKSVALFFLLSGLLYWLIKRKKVISILKNTVQKITKRKNPVKTKSALENKDKDS